jgi:hypothetical protein
MQSDVPAMILNTVKDAAHELVHAEQWRLGMRLLMRVCGF